ncbi:protein eva-1 homolog C isoform X2 [Lepisosteus oculatus]|uniref:protein eva-1 homolog C isoform X2 n=1 Tax=Lepisosteus oculatus TaxID=7918 RepID=UPI003718090C
MPVSYNRRTFLSVVAFLSVALCPHRLGAAPDFSVYLHKILRNHTAHACDGQQLAVTCPFRTAVAVLSAFYGRRVPSEYLCPGAAPEDGAGGSTDCTSGIAAQKVVDECQDQRSCQLPVNSRVFGLDPCPGTSKYLIVSYKCRPENHRSKLACENDRLRLVCRNDTVLAIYSATFGHLLHGSPQCPDEPASGPDMECLSPSALRKVSRRCHGRPNCSVLADTQSFGDPCFPGMKKHLRVSYACVPRVLLEELGRGSPDPFSISDYTHGGWYTGPGVSRLHGKVVVFTSALEVFARVWGLPETVALYFVSGICAGLVFLLCVFGLKSMVLRDVKSLWLELEVARKARLARKAAALAPARRELMADLEDDSSSDSSFRRLTWAYRTADTLFSSELTVEMEERGDGKELQEGDMWLPGDSSPYAIHKIQASGP